MGLKLNLGCGFKQLEGYVNVDSRAACNPDMVLDLETCPWPWEDSSVEEIQMIHVLEHLGETTSGYLGIIQELYRICKDGARVIIEVPHPRSEDFVTDPTHVRPITPNGLAMFDQDLNRQAIEAGAATTPLGVYLGVDFSVAVTKTIIQDPWAGRFKRGEITMEALQDAMKHYYNVIQNITLELTVHKPGRYTPT